MIERLDGMTKDIVKDNIEKLKELFPSIIRDNKIDFNELELLLGQDISNDKEQYSFVWNGKTEATKLAQKRSTGTLRPCESESKNWDTTKNIYIEGDNLEVLKLLQSSYNGKIKMIYIDPPYNTGRDFVYKDNFNDNIANYKEITGQAQKSNADTDGRYHTNWLNMMYPRLKLARNLLTEDGLIFISIDDNEVDNLKKICNDVFGELNFIAVLPTIMNLKGNNDEYGFSGTHEYTLVYSKSYKQPIFNNLRIKDKNKIKEEWEEDEYGYYKVATLKGSGENGAREFRPNLFYPIYLSKEGTFSLTRDDIHNYEMIPLSNGKEMTWRWSKEKLINERHNIIVTYDDGEYQINRKIRPENNIPSVKPKTLFYKEGYSSGNGVKVIKELFGARIFNYSKPVELIKDFIEIATDKNSIILDFFSGSATTPHSIFQLNAEDGGDRKFICVQLPEKTEENSEAFRAGYENICEIGKERIRRAGQKIQEELKQHGLERKIEGKTLLSSGTAGDLCHVEYKDNETGEITSESRFIHEPKDIYKYNPEKLDVGFRVFKLDSSNLKKWNNEPTKNAEEVANRIRQISFDYLEDGRTEIDLVYEIMLKYGIDLTLPVTKTANGKGYIVNGEDYKLLVCSEMNIKLEDIEEFANESVGTYLFADRCFSDDNLLINTQEILKSKNKEMRLF